MVRCSQSSNGIMVTIRCTQSKVDSSHVWRQLKHVNSRSSSFQACNCWHLVVCSSWGLIPGQLRGPRYVDRVQISSNDNIQKVTVFDKLSQLRDYQTQITNGRGNRNIVWSAYVVYRASLHNNNQGVLSRGNRCKGEDWKTVQQHDHFNEGRVGG